MFADRKLASPAPFSVDHPHEARQRRAVRAIAVLSAWLSIALLGAAQYAPRAAASAWLAPPTTHQVDPAWRIRVYDQKIAMSPRGDAVAAFQATDSQFQETLFATVRPAGGQWTTPEQISAKSGETDRLSLVMDSAGDALAIWHDVSSSP